MKKIIVCMMLIVSSVLWSQQAGTRSVSTKDTILTTTAKTISTASSLRMSETLVNNSTNDLYVSFDTTPALNKGFLVKPTGSLTYGGFTSIRWNGIVSGIAKTDTVFITKTTVFVQ